MSLKAGRVGVNPNQVDPVDGSIKTSATEGYSKQEADAKFETQIHADNIYQKKTLAIPISMLEGSLLVPKTTVEDVIQTMDQAMTNKDLTENVLSGWTTPVDLDISQTVLNGYGSLKITENVSKHLAAIVWLGNSTVPENILTLENFSFADKITETPLIQWNGIMRRGDCVIINADKTLTLITGTQSYSSCFVIFPTKP